MIATIYARKSTDQNLPDEEKSVARQVERARAYAQRKGWTVAEEHVYQDDGISGAEFLKRPGLLRLVNALKPRPPFQVLIMSEESRLGREQIETSYVLKQIIDAGVRVFFYLEDRERTLAGALDKVMLSLANFAAEMEREKARQRTYDAIRRKAERGHVAGGVVFGYRNVEVLSNGHRAHVLREVLDEEAAVVRGIFEQMAAGQGFLTIAKTLNAAAAPAPQPRRKGRPRGWAPSSVREIVFRELYRGRLVWGKTRWVDRGGTKVKQDRPESEWLTIDAQELRIVSEDLWQAAHARLDHTRAAYLGRNAGSRWGRPVAGLEGRYLLTGFLQCAWCAGGLIVRKRTQGRYRWDYLACHTHHARGEAICSNRLSARMDRAEADVLDLFRGELLNPVVVKRAIELAVEQLRPRADNREGERRRIHHALHQVDLGRARFVEAVRKGADAELFLEEDRAAKALRQSLEAQLQRLDAAGQLRDRFDDRAVWAELAGRLTDWQGLLGSTPAEARGVLRQLLRGRLIMTPTRDEETGPWYYTLSGTATYGRLLTGLVHVENLPMGMVPPG